jgi:hypothetical protein
LDGDFFQNEKKGFRPLVPTSKNPFLVNESGASGLTPFFIF